METVGAEASSFAGERDVVLEPAPRARQGCVAETDVAAANVTFELALDEARGRRTRCIAIAEVGGEVHPKMLQQWGTLGPARRYATVETDGELF